MDFELEQHSILCYETVGRASVCQEETMEAIVPDACPDILRIVDVCAQAFPKRWEAKEGQATVFGEIQAAVLYIPEEGTGLRRMELKLPFSCLLEMDGVTGESVLEVSTRIRCADGRMLNPRKVLLRADAAVSVTAFGRKELCVCSAVQTQNPDEICQLQSCVDYERTLSIPQRVFTVSEEVRLTGTQPPKLMASRASCVCTQSRVIGSKLIFKGKSDVTMLLLTPDGILEHRTETFPFSQVLEAKGVGETGECRVNAEVAELIVTQSEEDPYRVSVEMEIMAQGQVWEQEQLLLLSDMYSLTHHVMPQQQELVLNAASEEQIIPQTLRDLLETRDTVRAICDSRFMTGDPVCTEKDGSSIYTLPGQIVVLYLDEERQLRRLVKSIEISARASFDTHTALTCGCMTTQDVFAAPCAGGVEVRINVEFQIRCVRRQKRNMISQIQLGEARNTNGASPSVILRRPSPGESLWDMAKACGTTRERIMQANELTGEEIGESQMLLIPSAR